MRSHLCSAECWVYLVAGSRLCLRESFILVKSQHWKEGRTLLFLYRWGPQAERDELMCNDHPGNLAETEAQSEFPVLPFTYPDFSVILLLCRRSFVETRLYMGILWDIQLFVCQKKSLNQSRFISSSWQIQMYHLRTEMQRTVNRVTLPIFF